MRALVPSTVTRTAIHSHTLIYILTRLHLYTYTLKHIYIIMYTYRHTLAHNATNKDKKDKIGIIEINRLSL